MSTTPQPQSSSQSASVDASSSSHDQDGPSYLRFAAMIATSALVMFGLKYTSTYALDHVWFSETRAYMALLMGGAMAIVMLLFMLGMYKNTKVNAAILIGSLLLMAGSLFLMRSQTTVQDTSYMKAMVPHHSIAIMTSERAEIEDLRVRKLANEIIVAQRKEIKEPATRLPRRTLEVSLAFQRTRWRRSAIASVAQYMTIISKTAWRPRVRLTSRI